MKFQSFGFTSEGPSRPIAVRFLVVPALSEARDGGLLGRTIATRYRTCAPNKQVDQQKPSPPKDKGREYLPFARS
jgi:hypothetical protein